MVDQRNERGRIGLERSCDEKSPDWLRHTPAAAGVELLEAWFQGPAYRKHRHDTYAIGLTETGVQAFSYRGSVHISRPGDVVVLHPDEPHDGYAGADVGFGYRLLYVEPALIFDAVRPLCGNGSPLPFVRQPVVNSRKLSTAIREAFQGSHEPLAIDGLVVQLAAGLLDAAPSQTRPSTPRHLDRAAIERARQFLDAEKTRVVRSSELEAVTGISRFDLARQFQLIAGTSPYRYLLMRRLDDARAQLVEPWPLVDIALAAGFADQAHFTRMFSAAFGMTPARYRALSAER